MKFNLANLGIATSAKAENGHISLANESAFQNAFFSKPLTDFAVGYQNQEEPLQELLDFIAPPVQTTRLFQYDVQNGKVAFEAAAKGEDERALMGEFKVVDWMDGKATGATKSKGLTTFIDNDILEEIPSKLEEKVATLKCMLLRADLIRANALLVSLATNANKTWSSGTPTPDMDVKAAINAARAALGQQPNRVLFGGGAWEARDTALAKQNSAGAFAGLMRLESDVARFYRVRDLKINDLVYDLPGTGKTPIIADAKVFVFTGNTMPSTMDASNVKRFWSPVVGGGEWAVFVDRTHSAELTKVTVYHRSAILSPNAVGVQSLTIS